MKKTITILSLLLSSMAFQAQANDWGDVTRFPLISPLITSAATGMLTTPDQFGHKEAIQLINDGQDYFAAGKLNPYLEVCVEIVLEDNSDLSTAEAVDLLMDTAHSILN